MKKLIVLAIVFASLSSFADECTDKRSKPGYLSVKKVDCGRLWSNIIEPLITINGKTYPLAMQLVDGSGKCSSHGCYMPAINWQRRTNAICQAYGFERAGGSRTSDIFTTYDKFAVLKLNTKTNSFYPVVIKFTDKHVVLKKINCLPRY